jgi:alpha-L-fucosidase
LEIYRDWMDLHSASIYGCTQSDYTAPVDCRLTQNGRKLYVHVYAWPFRHLRLPGLGGKIEYARLLHDGSEVQLEANEWEMEQLKLNAGECILGLPVRRPNVVVPVIELLLKE